MSVARLVTVLVVVVVVAVASFPGWNLKVLGVQGSKRLKFSCRCTATAATHPAALWPSAGPWRILGRRGLLYVAIVDLFWAMR